MANERQIIQEINELVQQLQGTFTGLSEAIQHNLGNQAQLIQHFEELKKTIGSSKELKDFIKVNADLVKINKELQKEQENGLKMAKMEEQRRTAEIKTIEAATLAAEKQNQAKERTTQASLRTTAAKRREQQQVEKSNRAANEASRAYVQQSNRLRELTKQAQDAAIAYGTKDRRTRDLIRQQRALDAQIKRVDKSLGLHNRNVGNYSDMMRGGMRVLSQFGLAMGGAQIVMRSFNSLISSSQAMGDAWERQLNGISGMFEGLSRSIGTGETSLRGWITAMREGREAAIRYTKAQQELFHLSQGFKIIEAELNEEIAKQETLRRSMAQGSPERIAAAKEEHRLRMQLLTERTKELQDSFDAEANLVESNIKINREQFVSFLRNYREDKQLRESVLASRKEEAELEETIFRGRTRYTASGAIMATRAQAEAADAARDRIKVLRDSFTEEMMIYDGLLDQYEGATSEMIERFTNTFVAITDARTQAERQSSRAMQDILREEGDMKKEQVDNLEFIGEEREEFYHDQLDLALQWAQEDTAIWAEENKKKEDERIRVNAETNATLEKMAADHMAEKLKYLDLERQAEQQLAELRTQVNRQSYQLAGEAVKGVFDRKIELYERDIMANNQYYDSLLANEEMSEEQRSLIEAQREERENQLRERQAQAERRSFMFSQAIRLGEIYMDTAAAIMKVKATMPFPLSVPIAAMYKSQGMIQAGIVLAQTLPAFEKGTDNAPEGFATLGEAGIELVMAKDGRYSYLTKAEEHIGYLEKGSKVIPHHELMNAITNSTTNNILNDGGRAVNNNMDAKIIVANLMELKRSGDKNTKEMIRALTPKPQKSGNNHSLRREYLMKKLRS